MTHSGSQHRPCPRALASALLVLLLGPGCARTLTLRWEPAATIKAPAAARYPRASAVELLHNDAISISYPSGGGHSVHREQIHRRIAILTEEGLRWAEVRIPLGSSLFTELLALQARTILPDGRVRELAPADFRDEESKLYQEVIFQNNAALQNRFITKVFRFPEAQVGAVLEYVAVLEHRGMPNDFDVEPMARELPVEVYQSLLLVSPTVTFETTPYNLPAGVTFRRDTSGDFQRASIAVENLPGDEHEDLQPPWMLRSPWWSYRTLGVHSNDGWSVDIGSSWSRALWGFGERMLQQNSWIFSWDWPDVDRRSCPDGGVPCLASQALSILRDKAELTSFSSDILDMRSLRWVGGTATASSNEKAVLLYRMLDRAGVKATFAVTRRHIGLRDGDPVNPDILDHILLVLPEQPGLAELTWIDPSCEACAPGQVSPWIEGQDAFVVTMHSNVSDTTYDAQPMRIKGSPPPPALERTEYRARLADSGDLSVTATTEWRGSRAVDVRMDTRSLLPDQFAAQASAFVTVRARNGHLDESSPITCDRAAGTCTRTLRFTIPGYATADGGQLLLPLSLLHTRWDERFLDEKRVEDLWVGEAETTEEEAWFTLPPGWKVPKLPGSTRGRTPLLDTSLHAAATPDGFVAGRTIVTKPGLQSRNLYRGIRHAVRSLSGVRQQTVVVSKG